MLPRTERGAGGRSAMVTDHPVYDDGVLRITRIADPPGLAMAGEIDESTSLPVLARPSETTDRRASGAAHGRGAAAGRAGDHRLGHRPGADRGRAGLAGRPRAGQSGQTA